MAASYLAHRIPWCLILHVAEGDVEDEVKEWGFLRGGVCSWPVIDPVGSAAADLRRSPPVTIVLAYTSGYERVRIVGAINDIRRLKVSGKALAAGFNRTTHAQQDRWATKSQEDSKVPRTPLVASQH